MDSAGTDSVPASIVNVPSADAIWKSQVKNFGKRSLLAAADLRLYLHEDKAAQERF
jgi:hypothetical protein